MGPGEGEGGREGRGGKRREEGGGEREGGLRGRREGGEELTKDYSTSLPSDRLLQQQDHM